MGEQVLDFREWAGFGEGHRLGDLLLDLLIDPQAGGPVDQATQPLDLIVVDPGLQLRTRTVAGLVVFARADMLPPPVGVALQELRAAASPRTIARWVGIRPEPATNPV